MKKISLNYNRKNPGHYSPGIIHNGVLYISGQLPLNPETGEKAEGGLASETKQALSNLDDVLKAANTGRDSVISCRIYVSDINYWDEINEIYRDFFGDHKPARIVVPSGPLHFGCMLEIEAVAALE